jgi:light-regulated signal transduction histidine kinase (bacteriophytochrome)
MARGRNVEQAPEFTTEPPAASSSNAETAEACLEADPLLVTTKQQGLGLGLCIARRIIEGYGGKIWAENRPEGGAVVRFTLPLAEVRQA